MICQCSDCCWPVLFCWCELNILSIRSQSDSASLVFSPFFIGTGIDLCIVVVAVCFSCAFAAVVGMPMAEFSF